MGDATMIEQLNQRSKLNSVEREILQANIEKAFVLARDKITKDEQCINLAYRMQDGRMQVVLEPGIDLLASEQRPTKLNPEDDELLTNALSNVFGEVENSSIQRGVISRQNIQGRSVREFLEHDYAVVRRGTEPMTVEWTIESKVGNPYIKVLQLEIKKVGKDTAVNWNIIGRKNLNWLGLPMEGGIRVK